ncbi:YbaB/EbfC family nucleoid-associated protein [Saccharothrix sp. NRRL B-16348]|uniref:YbaB/EbfC family nucleoid-associated protein n=1 Tax=Saccharothrix sp. NRRL B-16348 TaxID=1415542 RepID=UPI0006ADFD73|nr:YbaB/EbfC family nucleoid-associated protein [Saccharothrix sp. NRRL B-16348]
MNSDELNRRAGELTARAADLYSRVHRREETLRAARERAVAATGEASAPDGSVRVTVDAGGMVTGLELAPSALASNPARLAALVVRVAQEAAGQARAAVREVYTPLQREGVLRDAPVLLPEPTSPRVAPPPRPRPRDDDFERPVLRDDGW